MALALMVVGAVLTAAGAALMLWEAGVVVAGVLLIAAGVDLARREPPAS